MRTPRVLLITDPRFADEVVLRAIDAAGRALPSGDFAVQLRDKARPDRAGWASQLREVTLALGVPLIVNGDVALARAVRADGVHFGGAATDDEVASGERLWRSVAAHADDDVARACARGVDAVLVSPIFASPGKGEPRGVAALRSAADIARARLAVLALGGVGEREVDACRDAGADGIAVIRALLDAPDGAVVAAQMGRAWRSSSQHRADST